MCLIDKFSFINKVGFIDKVGVRKFKFLNYFYLKNNNKYSFFTLSYIYEST